MGITVGLLECPLDMALASPGASDSRGRAGSDDAFCDLILEVTDTSGICIVTCTGSGSVNQGGCTITHTLGGRGG